MSTQTFDVVGMTCGHCASAVTEELEALDGVTRRPGRPGRRRHLGRHRGSRPRPRPGEVCGRPRRGRRLQPRAGRRMTALTDAGSHDRHSASGRARHRRHDLRLLRHPDREEAQPDRRRHRHRQLRHREGQGHASPRASPRTTSSQTVERTGYTARSPGAEPPPARTAGDDAHATGQRHACASGWSSSRRSPCR